MRSSDTSSIERTDTWVHTEERSDFKNTEMQSALKSLFGLIMASGPILSHLTPQAHFPPTPSTRLICIKDNRRVICSNFREISQFK